MSRVTVYACALTFATVAGCASHARAVDPLVTNFGLGHILHPMEEAGGCTAPNGPGCCPDHVYVFGVNGLNPLCSGNFNGLCAYVREHGYCNTYFGQLYTSHWYASKIREIRRCDPEAKVVLIGFSLGANYVKAVANNLNKDGTRVDLLIYLVGDYVCNKPSSHPDNVCRVVNVRAKGLVLTGGDLFFNGEDMDGAYNTRLECRHILVPSRKETIQLVMCELNKLACPCPPGLPPGPAPALPVPAAPAIGPDHSRSPYDAPRPVQPGGLTP